jgi:hypothetical protein
MAAYTRAVRALDEFDVCTAEYRLMLDTQRALLLSENFDGMVHTMVRGDEIARRAASCGRQIAPVREGLSGGNYVGPRTTELRRRLSTASAAAELLGSSVAQVTAACAIKRDMAASELGEAQNKSVQVSRPARGYAAQNRPTNAIDIRY